MRKKTFLKLISLILTVAMLTSCCITFCGCHVFAWYIPKPYNDEQMAKIYDVLKSQLDGLEHIIASVGYEQNGLSYYYSIFSDDSMIIISYDVFGGEEYNFNTVKRGLYFEGTLKEWDVEQRSETVTSKDIADYGYLLERVRETADFFKTQVLDVMPYRDDSYCWQCFPWDVGMAQMYYLPDDDSSVSASWTIENNYDSKSFPLIYEAEFHYSSGSGDSVWITTYREPYGIDERITNIKENYEEDKQRDEKMLYKQIYVKGFEDTLTLELYNNDAAKALLNKLSEGDVTFTVDDYGDFEKVGSLGFSLPTCDEQLTAECHDVMLYQGSQIVIFYGQNTWAYTPLGYIPGYSEAAFADVIGAGKGKMQITLSLNRE